MHCFSHSSCCWNIDLNPKNEVFIVATDLGLSVWSMTDSKLSKELKLGPNVYDARFNEEGDKIVACTHAGKVYLINLKYLPIETFL